MNKTNEVKDSVQEFKELMERVICANNIRVIERKIRIKEKELSSLKILHSEYSKKYTELVKNKKRNISQ